MPSKITHFPYYKKTFYLGEAIPLIAYGSLTSGERIWQTDLSWEKQREDDERELVIIEEISTLLEIKIVDAMGIYKHVQDYRNPGYDLEDNPLECRWGTPAKRELAAVELAEKKNRKKPKEIAYEQYTFYLQSRLDRTVFDKSKFEDTYGEPYEGEWTLDHTMAIAELHPALDAFLISEMRGEKVEPPSEEISEGEPIAA